MAYDEVQQAVIEAFDLKDIPEEDQDAFTIKFGELVYQAVLARAAELLSEEDLETFDELASNDADLVRLFEFLEEKIDNLGEIITEEATRLKSEFDELYERNLQHIENEEKATDNETEQKDTYSDATDATEHSNNNDDAISW